MNGYRCCLIVTLIVVILTQPLLQRLNRVSIYAGMAYLSRWVLERWKLAEPIDQTPDAAPGIAVVQ